MNRGPAPAPRYRLNPFFVRNVRNDPRPLCLLAERAGWRQGRGIYYVVSPDAVIAATPRTVARLRMLASLVGFPPDQVFAEEAR